MGDKAKQSFYFPSEMISEIRAEAARQDRSVSWVVQQAWKLARAKLQEFPAPPAERREDDRSATSGAGWTASKSPCRRDGDVGAR